MLQSAYVYGLYDPRVDDMFYIGSTIRPSRRYSDHLRGKHLSNFREAWIMAILADGSQPLFYLLYEFITACELEIKVVEDAIAQEWRMLGHTAMCDGQVFPQNWNRYAWRYEVGERWDFLEQCIAEYLAMVNEQARVVRWLREL